MADAAAVLLDTDVYSALSTAILLRVSEPVPCDCEPDLDETHFARQCDYCGTESAGRRCMHDRRQDPCPECDVVPVAQLPPPRDDPSRLTLRT